MSRYKLAPLAAMLGAVAAIALTAAPAAATKPHPPPPPPPAYTMTDLGSLGYGVSRGFAINNSGEIVGESHIGQAVPVQCPVPRHTGCVTHPLHAFSWTAGTMTDLTPGTQNTSTARAINTAGDIVGRLNANGFLLHNGQMTNLGGLTPGGINDFGEIVGGTQGHAFLLSAGKLTILPDPAFVGAGGASASAINNNHQIIGGSDDTASDLHALMWSNGTVTDLGTLGGSQSDAYAINNLGQVTGWSHTASEATHVFLYSNGTMQDLGAPFLDPVGYSINDHGVIVGQGAFIWSNGVFQNLNNLIPPGSGFTLDTANAINNNGQIVADGYNAQGQEHAFLLTPSG